MLLFSSITFSGDAIIRALSWTLFHSLWQGVLLSLIAGCIMVFTKRVNPLLRYNLLAAALVLFVTGVAATFITQLVSTAQTVEVSVMQVSQLNIGEPSANPIAITTELSIIDKAVDFLNINANWIVLTWLLIIGYKFILLSSGFYNMYQLKRRQVSSPGEYWNNRITELCHQLQVNKKVQLLQSHIIRIPAVIGYFKPVILFPAAMLTAMPLHEVEAVLIHELGHIRRKDFMVNMLQNITEIVFFFNPAVLWVSSLIKTERENCCDDIAVTNTANKQDYIKALISFQQFNLPETRQLAMAFSGEENHLLSRVKRIVYNKNKTLNNMEKKFLSVSLILVSVCLFAFVSDKTRDDKKTKTPVLQPVSVSTTETKPISAVNKQETKKEKTIILQPVSVSSNKTTDVGNVFANIDSVPFYKIGGNTNLTGETNTFIDGKAYRIVIKNSVITEMYIEGQEIPNEKIIDYKPLLDKQFAQMIKNKEKAMRESEQAMRDREQAMRDREKAVQESDQAVRNSEKAIKESDQAVRDSEESNRKMDKIIEELISNGIIKNSEELYSFRLNRKELKINGVKQSSSIHEKYLKKYGKGLNSTLTYVYEVN